MDTKANNILPFGGWSFSTEADSFLIFRSAVTSANRKTFATNVVKFAEDNGLNGIDFDWEYPGAPDILGILPGDKGDGDRYSESLELVPWPSSILCWVRLALEMPPWSARQPSTATISVPKMAC
ncbi:hypothetical protein F5B18DRAFT_651407 [Nemania serpens]|nr:hypothetical protein F5B18DRAFT_651407 [Nemania serpens]